MLTPPHAVMSCSQIVPFFLPMDKQAQAQRAWNVKKKIQPLS